MSRGPRDGNDDGDEWGQTLPDTPAVQSHQTVRAGVRSHERRGPGPGAKDFPELPTIDADTYVITGELAHGGMGRILAARDRRLGRPVAIKEVLGGAGNAGVRARFERETRITARLQHPAIVNVLEAGRWASGEPFFAMKLIEGASLDVAVTRCKTVGERMALIPHIIAAVDALAYAHDRGVIHRDLKPQNVLVGKYGETVVIDWGLAKELAAGEAKVEADPHRTRPPTAGGTLDGEVMGTPAFMPREQALGDPVDARADVYALGAILYYVLTGQPPFQGKTAAALLSAVIGDVPRPLASLVPGIPEDLQTIVAKAMALDKADRYPDAGALATDLKHFQTGQLVGSHRYSRWQRLGRFVRRHRAAVAITSVSLVLMVIGGTIAVRRILAEQAQAEAERRVAVDSRAEAEGLLDFMLYDLADKLRPVGKLDLLGAVASRAVDYYQDRPEAAGTDELRKRARALGNLGQVLFELGQLEGAQVQFATQLALFERMRDEGQLLAPSDWQLLAEGHQAVAAVGNARGQPQAALDHLRQAYELQLAHQDGSEAAQQALVRAIRLLALQRLKMGDDARALVELRRAQWLADPAFVLAPLQPAWQAELMALHNALAEALGATGDHKGALAERRLQLIMARQLAAGDPDDATRLREVSVAHSGLARDLEALGDIAGAIAERRADLVITERLTARDPTNKHWLADLANVHYHLGALLAVQGDLDGSLAALRAGLAINERLYAAAPDDVRLARMFMAGHSNIADVLAAKDDLAGAAQAHRRSLVVAKELLAANPDSEARQDDVVLCENALGIVLYNQGELAEAEAHYLAAIAAARRRSERDPDDLDGLRGLLVSHGNYGELLLARKDAAGGLAELRKTLAVVERWAAVAPDSAEAQAYLVECKKLIASALLAQGDRDGGLASYRDALALAEKLAARDPGNAEAREAVAALREAVATCCSRR
jgi:serine/threonine protein kinase